MHAWWVGVRVCVQKECTGGWDDGGWSGENTAVQMQSPTAYSFPGCALFFFCFSLLFVIEIGE